MTPEQPLSTTETINTPNSERQSSNWDIRNAPRNYLSLVAYQVMSAAFSFCAVWLITRHLGSEGYGGIIAIIAASQVAQVFVNWTSTAVVRFGVDEFVETEKISRTFWVRLIVLVVNLLVVVLISRLWFPTLADWLKLSPETFWLVIAHFVVTVFWVHVQMSLQAAKLPRAQGLLQMIERLLIFVGIFALTAAANLKLFEAMLCYIIAPAAMTVVGLFRLRHYIGARFQIDSEFVRKVFTYSIPLLPFSLVGYFAGSYVDAIFISKFLSTHDLGIYSIATQINGVALQLPTLANTLLLPLFITLQKESQNERTSNYFSNVLPSLTLLWGLSCALLSFVLSYAIPAVFGVAFAEAAAPAWILLTATAVSLPVLIGYAAISHAYSMTYVSFVSVMFSATTNLIANFALIPRFGLVGCAWATVIAYFVGYMVFAVLLRRAIAMPLSWVFFAMLPVLIGALVFTYEVKPVIAMAGCLISFLLVAITFKGSLTKGMSFLLGSKKRLLQ